MKTPEDEEGWHLEIMLMGSQENRRGELWKNTAPPPTVRGHNP